MSATDSTNISDELALFLERFRACSKARPWARRYRTFEDAWQNCHNPEWLLWALKRARFDSPLKYREWACWCVRQAWHLVPDERCRSAVETAERFLADQATPEDLSQAHARAKPAATASWTNAAAAWAARAAVETASPKPSAAARSAAEAAAWSSDSPTAWATARAAQADKLRQLIGSDVISQVAAQLRGRLFANNPELEPREVL